MYLNAATEFLIRKQGQEKHIVPAGILYYHIDDPLIEEGGKALSDEDIRRKIYGELRMKGLVNEAESVYRLFDNELDAERHPKSDIIPVRLTKNNTLYADSSTATTEEFQTVTEYVNAKIVDMGREILDGNIRIEPHAVKEDNGPCLYCQYKDICNRQNSGESLMAREKLSRKEVIAKMRRNLDERK